MKTTISDASADRPTRSKISDRRKFLTGLAVGAGLAPLATLFRQPLKAGTAPTAADLCFSQQKPLLGPQDITYVGHYDVQTNGNDTTYARGLAVRYVNGDLRFLNLQLNGELHEFSLAGKSYGDTVRTTTNRWSNPAGVQDFTTLWWEEQRQRLWSASAVDYTATAYPTAVYTRTLNSNGSVANVLGPVSLSGIPAKRVYGGVLEFPAWFRSQYGVAQVRCGIWRLHEPDVTGR